MSFVEYKEIFNSNIMSGNLLGNIFADMSHLQCPDFPWIASYCTLQTFLMELAGDSNKSDMVAKKIIDVLAG